MFSIFEFFFFFVISYSNLFFFVFIEFLFSFPFSFIVLEVESKESIIDEIERSERIGIFFAVSSFESLCLEKKRKG